jgi:hypothetical protein
MVYLIDPSDTTLSLCIRNCKTVCGIKPMYGIPPCYDVLPA